LLTNIDNAEIGCYVPSWYKTRNYCTNISMLIGLLKQLVLLINCSSWTLN